MESLSSKHTDANPKNAAAKQRIVVEQPLGKRLWRFLAIFWMFYSGWSSSFATVSSIFPCFEVYLQNHQASFFCAPIICFNSCFWILSSVCWFLQKAPLLSISCFPEQGICETARTVISNLWTPWSCATVPGLLFKIWTRRKKNRWKPKKLITIQ